LGTVYEETHAFDKDILGKLSKPYQISKFMLSILNLVDKVGLSNTLWHSELKKNNAFDKRLDKPFLYNGGTKYK